MNSLEAFSRSWQPTVRFSESLDINLHGSICRVSGHVKFQLQHKLQYNFYEIFSHYLLTFLHSTAIYKQQSQNKRDFAQHCIPTLRPRPFSYICLVSNMQFRWHWLNKGYWKVSLILFQVFPSQICVNCFPETLLKNCINITLSFCPLEKSSFRNNLCGQTCSSHLQIERRNLSQFSPR